MVTMPTTMKITSVTMWTHHTQLRRLQNETTDMLLPQPLAQ